MLQCTVFEPRANKTPCLAFILWTPHKINLLRRTRCIRFIDSGLYLLNKNSCQQTKRRFPPTGMGIGCYGYISLC